MTTQAVPWRRPIFDGMVSTMRTTMDKGGRIVVPKELREQLRLQPGQEFEVRIGNELEIVIEPVHPPVTLTTSDDGLPVFVAEGTEAPITDEDLRRWREVDGQEREGPWT